MLTLSLALALGFASDPLVEACAEREQSQSEFVHDVCSEFLEGEIAYSATLRTSLTPQPAVRQVMVYRTQGEWFVWIAGYRWERGTSLVQTRRHDLPISAEDAARIEERLNAQSLARLAALPYYGEEDVICMDGASLEIAAAIDGQRHSAGQHICAGQTELTEISRLFHELALKYDSGFEGYLSGI